MPAAAFVPASAARLRRGRVARATATHHRPAPAMLAAKGAPPPSDLPSLVAALSAGGRAAQPPPPPSPSSQLSPQKQKERQERAGQSFAPEQRDAYAAQVLARRSTHAAALVADDGAVEPDVDEAAASIVADAAPDGQPLRAAPAVLALDAASVRRLALLDGDGEDDFDAAGAGVRSDAGAAALEAARSRVLERRRRAREAAEAGKEAEPADATAPRVPSQGRVYTASTPDGAVVALPFRPAAAEAQGLAKKSGEQYRALFRAVDNVPMAMDGAPLCPRCERPAEQDELDANPPGICAPCHAAIHNVRSSVAALGDQDAAGQYRSEAERAEVQEMEDRTTAAARAVTQALIAKRKGSAAIATSTTAATVPVFSRAAATDAGRESVRAAAASGVRPGAGSAELSRGGKATRDGDGVEGAAGGGAGGETGDGGGLGSIGTGSARAGRGEARGWSVKASDRSMRTINPIRQLVQGISGEPNPDKELIDLSVGDPTRYGNLVVGDDIVEEFCKVVRAGKSNGYTQSMGSVDARRAVAARYSIPDVAPLDHDDVLLTAGVSGALEMALGALANEGDNVLLPRPGFPLFKTMLDGFGVEARYYSVLPDRAWEIKVDDLVAQADDRTAAIVINNPSNPCGSVYSAEHIQAILDAASLLKLPIVADEVYADMVFSGQEFVPIASLPSDVPVLSVGGASKQFVVPGWRAGWLLIHDRGGVLAAGGVRTGLRQLSTRMLMTNAPVQAMLPVMLAAGAAAPAFRRLMADLERNACATMDGLAGCAGLTCVPPQGSMYLMAKVDVEALGFADDLEFTKALRAEESVFVLPGQCFLAENYVRLVFCAPPHVLSEATGRIKEFCARRAESVIAATAD